MKIKIFSNYKKDKSQQLYKKRRAQLIFQNLPMKSS